MRHVYTADVGDFGKCGLLRALHAGDQAVRLGVVWYLTDAQEHNNDGKHDGYLKYESQQKRDLYRKCDPGLYEELQKIRKHKRLDVTQLQNPAVIPAGTVFYGAVTPTFGGTAAVGRDGVDRWQVRDVWHATAVQTMRPVTCVFTDPDNGILFTPPNVAREERPSHKHSYWHELADYLDAGKSVVAYHHLGRQRGGHQAQIRDHLSRIRGLGRQAWAIRYCRGTSRALFVIPSDRDSQTFKERSEEFVEAWNEHAELLT